MAGEQADRVVDEIDAAMSRLRTSMRGVPIRYAGFKREHDVAAKAVAQLSVLISDARNLFTRSK